MLPKGSEYKVEPFPLIERLAVLLRASSKTASSCTLCGLESAASQKDMAQNSIYANFHQRELCHK